MDFQRGRASPLVACVVNTSYAKCPVYLAAGLNPSLEVASFNDGVILGRYDISTLLPPATKR